MSEERDVIRLQAKVSALEAEVAKHKKAAGDERYEVGAANYRAKRAEERIAEMTKEAERAAKVIQQEREEQAKWRSAAGAKDGTIATLQAAVLSWEQECLELRAKTSAPARLHASAPIAEALVDFDEDLEEHQDLARATLLHYEYEQVDYGGDALCVYELDGKLYEVEGSHCSCNGLEGQWEPAETTAEALLMRPHLPAELRAKLEAMVPV